MKCKIDLCLYNDIDGHCQKSKSLPADCPRVLRRENERLKGLKGENERLRIIVTGEATKLSLATHNARHMSNSDKRLLAEAARIKAGKGKK